MADAFALPAPTTKTSARSLWFVFVLLTVIGFAGHRYNFSRTYHSGTGFTTEEYADVTKAGDPFSWVRSACLLGFTAAIYARHRRALRPRLTTAGWFMGAFYVWNALTLTWSVDPFISTRRFAGFAIYGLAALAAGRYFHPRGLALWVLISTFVYIHLGVGIELMLGTFRPWDAEYRFAGTLHPNNQAFNCVLLAFAGVFLWRGAKAEERVRWFYAAAACEGFAFLLLTKSRTSLGCAIVTLAVLALATAAPTRRVVLALAGGAATCLAVLSATLLTPLLTQATTLGRPDSENTTLTGRLPLWQQCLGYVSERPIGGWGFGAFWTRRHLIEVATEQGWMVPDAHSSYVDLLLGTGAVGAVLYVCVIVAAVREAVRLYRASGDGGFAFVGAILIFVALAGTSESIVFSGNHVSFVCLLAIGTTAIAHEATRSAVKLAPVASRSSRRIAPAAAAGLPNGAVGG